MSEKIELRKADYNDYYTVWLVRNEPTARANSINSDFIPLDSHKKWFEKHFQEYQIIVVGKKDVGYLRLQDGYVSIGLLPLYQNKGIESAVLKKLDKGTAIVKNNKPASVKCFLNAGFKVTGVFMEK